MKKIIFLAIGVAITVAAFAQSTQQRGTVQTSRFSREALTNETAASFRAKLGITATGNTNDAISGGTYSNVVLTGESTVPHADNADIASLASSLGLAALNQVAVLATNIAQDQFAIGVQNSNNYNGTFSGDGSALTGIEGLTSDPRFTNSSGTTHSSSNTFAAPVFSGSGSGLTGLPASSLTGTIADERMPVLISSDITGSAATATYASIATNLTSAPRLFSPLNYGGIGNGVADDTVAVSNCLRAANLVDSPTMDLSALIWNVNMSLVVTGRNFTLKNGKLTTTNNAIRFVDVRADNFVSDHVFLGGPNTNWTTNCIGYYFERPSTYIQRPRIEYGKVTNFWHGVVAVLAVEGLIEHSQITACGSNGVWAYACDGFEINKTVLGNSTPTGGNLLDPGYGTASSQTNGMCFYFDSGIRQIVQNCDMNACGSIGQVINTSGGTPHFEMRNNNFEEFWNSNRPYLLMSNVSYHIAHNKFSIKAGPVTGGIKAVNCVNGKSFIGPQTSVGLSPRIEIIGSAGILPYVEGYWTDNADNELITYRATEGGAASIYGQTTLGPYTLIQRRVTVVDGQSQAGFLLGGNSGSYGLSNNTAKKFTFAIPSYGSQTPVGFMIADMFRDNNNALVLGCNDNNTAMRYVDIKTSTDGTYLSPSHQWRFSSSGLAAIADGMHITSSGSVTAKAFINTMSTNNLTADNSTIYVTNTSVYVLSSDDPTYWQRTFTLSAGIDGKLVCLAWTGTNAAELLDDSITPNGGNVRLAGDWVPGQYDSILLLAVGLDWHEISRSGGGITASSVVSGITNQWMIDATNAVAGALTTFTTIIRTNATTADWQTAFNTGGTIFVIPGTYVLTTNVAITNSFKLIGNGAVIQASAGVTNFLFDSGTNTLPGPVEIENLQFDGERSINYRAAGYFAWNSGSPSPYFNPYWTNRSALRLSGDNPGSVSYCKFYGWPGQGLMIVNPLNLAAYTKPNIQIVYNSFYSNFIGCILAGHAATTVGYYNNPAGGWMTAEGEYTRVMGNTFTRNTIALDATPGNAQVFANRMTDNGCAMLVASSVNAAHGTYSVNTMNHNDYGIVAESNLGGVYSGNVIIANNTANVIMNNCQWVKFDGNFVGSEWVTFTNGCVGSFRNNQFDGTWGTNTKTNFTGSPGMRVEGNYSDSVAGGHDGSIISYLATGNGVGLTNLPGQMRGALFNVATTGTLTYMAPLGGNLVHANPGVVKYRTPTATRLSNFWFTVNFATIATNYYYQVWTNPPGVTNWGPTDLAVVCPVSVANKAGDFTASNLTVVLDLPAGTGIAIGVTNESATSATTYNNWVLDERK